MHTLSVWLQPPVRHLPALVPPEDETSSLLHDLDILGLPHDIDGVVTR